MFNFHNRHYIFRQSDGQIRDFYCDMGQNLCCSTLGRNGLWSGATVISRNVHQYFCAELDRDDYYHILFQDNNGNIIYARTDGQYVKTFPVLNSKTPAVYNKQLYIAPLGDEIWLFYVLQHDNSFLLAYQLLKDNRPGAPKIVDYVSGSSIPCSVLYDFDRNIYAFYQSYDGKYLQLGYKKFYTARKHWSDFTAVTKYQGNCEYPHAVMDSSGTIHLCYQRRAPKLFELVYQQKAPDRNLWSAETVLHSSVHPFENASVLRVDDRIIVYWIRDDIIYWCADSLSGDNWTRPARYGSQPGRRLQCICFKDQRGMKRERDGSPEQGDGSQIHREGDGSAFSVSSGKSGRDGSPVRDGPAVPVSSGNRSRDSFAGGGGSSGQGDGSQISLSPGIYPGVVSDGFRLAFVDTSGIISGQRLPRSPQSAAPGGDASVSELKSLLLSTFREIQDKISEMDAEWAEVKREIPKLANAYAELAKETEKLSIRLGMLENRLAQANDPYRRPGSAKRGPSKDISGSTHEEKEEERNSRSDAEVTSEETKGADKEGNEE